MRTHKKDTASPCSFASFGVSSKVLSGTSHDASEEVFLFPAPNPIATRRGKAARHSFNRAESGGSVKTIGAGERRNE